MRAMHPCKAAELAKREGGVYRVASEKEKEITDRVVKLEKVEEPRSNSDCSVCYANPEKSVCPLCSNLEVVFEPTSLLSVPPFW